MLFVVGDSTSQHRLQKARSVLAPANQCRVDWAFSTRTSLCFVVRGNQRSQSESCVASVDNDRWKAGRDARKRGADLAARESLWGELTWASCLTDRLTLNVDHTIVSLCLTQYRISRVSHDFSMCGGPCPTRCIGLLFSSRISCIFDLLSCWKMILIWIKDVWCKWAIKLGLVLWLCQLTWCAFVRRAMQPTTYLQS